MDAIGPFAGRLDAELIRRYRDATNDRSAGVPPLAIVTQIWDAQEASRADLVPEVLQRAAGVHGEHDVVLHRPLAVGEPLRTWVTRHGVRPAGRNALVTLRYETRDADDAVVAEQWWTTAYLAASCDESGDRPPDHAFPADARDRPLGTYEVDVDAGMARRYAEASGDWSAHHFDLDAARRSGADRPFLHGLCTMALCARAIVQLVADGDAARLRRAAVRFASTMPLGETLVVRLYDAGDLGVAFEAHAKASAVITHGRAELH